MRDPKLLPTPSRVKELFIYDSQTGEFRWRIKPARRIAVGALAGTIDKDGYRWLKIDKVAIVASHVAWAYMTGAWPAGLLDHENGDPGDDSFNNLREATHSENMANRKIAKSNKSGFKGVFPNWKGWSAQIGFEGKRFHLGTFPSPELAHAAYVNAAAGLHGKFARLQ